MNINKGVIMMTKTEKQKMEKMEALLKFNNIAVPKDKETLTITKEVEVKITEEEFDLYLDVQYSGLVNMYRPEARQMVGLTKTKWMTIMKYYDDLLVKYGKE